MFSNTDCNTIIGGLAHYNQWHILDSASNWGCILIKEEIQSDIYVRITHFLHICHPTWLLYPACYVHVWSVWHGIAYELEDAGRQEQNVTSHVTRLFFNAKRCVCECGWLTLPKIVPCEHPVCPWVVSLHRDHRAQEHAHPDSAGLALSWGKSNDTNHTILILFCSVLHGDQSLLLRCTPCWKLYITENKYGARNICLAKTLTSCYTSWCQVPVQHPFLVQWWSEFGSLKENNEGSQSPLNGTK